MLRADQGVGCRGEASRTNRGGVRQVTQRDASPRPVPHIERGGVLGVTAAGSNSVAARGTLQIPLTLRYNLPTGDRLATVTTTVNFTDSRSNTIVQSAMLRII